MATADTTTSTIIDEVVSVEEPEAQQPVHPKKIQTMVTSFFKETLKEPSLPKLSTKQQKARLQLKVRPIQESEIQQLADMDVEMCRMLSDETRPIDPLGRDWLIRRLGADRKSYKNWHAVSVINALNTAEKPLGFAIVSHETDRSRKGKRRKKTTKYLELFWIMVSTKYQGRGVGKFLLLETMKQSQNRDEAIKEVH